MSFIFLFITVVRSLPPVTNVAGNSSEDKMVIPHGNTINLEVDGVVCVNSTKGTPMLDIGDCSNILRQFEASPKYRTNQVWVGYGRRAEPDQVQTPAGNRNGKCLIAVNAQDAMKTDVFRVIDVAIKARIIMRTCYPDPGVVKYGGIMPVGNGRSFRVSVEPNFGVETGGTMMFPLG